MDLENSTVFKELTQWYIDQKTDYPWDQRQEPYEIWISEVILQQTQVVQAVGYYERFLSSFPDVQTLAHAEQDEVLKTWQGLGYYSRARNLHKAAKLIVDQYNGTFPQTYEKMLQLPGVGPYTAAAICAFAYRHRIPALDGNLHRVLSRFYFQEWKRSSSRDMRTLTQLTSDSIPHQAPHLWNKAMMLLGRQICTPRNPSCSACPLSGKCLSLANGEPAKYPLPTKKKAKKQRHFHYLWIDHNEGSYISQRGNGDIWQGLYEPPLVELNSAELRANEEWDESLDPLPTKVHQTIRQLTHQTIYIHFYQWAAPPSYSHHGLAKWYSYAQLRDLPFPASVADFVSEQITKKK